MLGIESIPDIKLIKGANTTCEDPCLESLWEQMGKERALKQNELKALKALEDLPESS